MRAARRKPIRFSGRAIGLLGVVALILGCGGPAEDEPTGGKNVASEVTLALNWFPDAQHGGFYVARSASTSNEAPSIRLIPGGPGAPVVQNVAMRRHDFGVGNADQILVARSQGAPIVAVFAAMQTSPRCIMAHASKNLRSFDDLHDLKMSIGTGKAYASFLKSRLPLTNVTFVPYTGSITPFLGDPELVQQAYVFSEPFLVKQQGASPTTLMVADLGFNPYTSCLFAHEQLVAENPGMVKQVVTMVRDGWQQYLTADAAAVHESIVLDNPKMDLQSLDFGRSQLRPLCIPEKEASTLGMMSEERWETLANQLAELDLLPPSADWKNAYTTRFLE